MCERGLRKRWLNSLRNRNNGVIMEAAEYRRLCLPIVYGTTPQTICTNKYMTDSANFYLCGLLSFFLMSTVICLFLCPTTLRDFSPYRSSEMPQFHCQPLFTVFRSSL